MSEQNPEFDDVDVPDGDEPVLAEKPDLTGVQDDGVEIPIPDDLT